MPPKGSRIVSRPNARTRGLFCPHERRTAKEMRRFAVVPLQSTPFQHADERNQEGRRDNKAPASSPFGLPVYALIYLLISGGADTGVIPSTSAYFISSPRDRSNSLCRRKKRGTLQERFRFPFASRTFFCLVFLGAPSFFFFFPVKFFLSSTLLPYVLSIFGRRRGSRHNPLGPPVVVFRVSSPPARAVPFFRIERIIIIIFFFPLRIIRSSRGDGFRARGRHGYREQRTARSHSRP